MFSRILDNNEHIPYNLSDLTIFESIVGSSMHDPTISDIDVIGIYVPPKEEVFPHLAGEISGFGKHVERNRTYSFHKLSLYDRKVDISTYSIVKYVQFLVNGSPNIIESLFSPRTCIYNNAAAYLVENRHMFLTKYSCEKMMSCAYQMLQKADCGKHFYQSLQLMLQAQSTLENNDIDLTEHSNFLLSVRNNEISKNEVLKMSADLDLKLKSLLKVSTLAPNVDEQSARIVLAKCLEHFYGRNYLNN